MLSIACGLPSTLGLAVHCNTAIRLWSVCYVLVPYRLKFVCLLVTTLGIVVCCNTVIRP